MMVLMAIVGVIVDGGGGRNFIMYSMIMYSRSVKFNGITSPSRPSTLMTTKRTICDVIECRAVVSECLTCSAFDDVTDDVILPLGWVNYF